MGYANLKPKELSKEFNTTDKSHVFSYQWEKMIHALATEIIKQGYIIQNAEDTYSGGGCHHFFIHTTNGHIFGMHSETILEYGMDEIYDKKGEWVGNHVHFFWERSHGTWHTIDEYFEDENDDGFGFEFDLPDYEERTGIIKLDVVYPKKIRELL